MSINRWMDKDMHVYTYIYIYKMEYYSDFQLSSVQLFSCVWLFATPWTAAHQPTLSSNIAWSLLKFMSIESVKLSNHLNLSLTSTPFSFCLQFFPISGSFPVSQLFASGGQSIRALASATVFPMNIQGWFPLGLTSWISLWPKGLSRVFSNTNVEKHQLFGTQLSL